MQKRTKGYPRALSGVPYRAATQMAHKPINDATITANQQTAPADDPLDSAAPDPSCGKC